MFVHITLHRIKAEKVSDHPWDPLNRRVELYQTWQLSALDMIDGKDTAKWARQGFSTRGAPDDGASFSGGDSRVVVDPQIALGLPDLDEGQVVRYRFDVHYWESDSATEKVRTVFTDSTLEYMARAWKAAKEDQDKASKELGQWLERNWQSMARGLIAAASPATAGVLQSYDLLPLLEKLFRYVQASGDDYHQMHRYVLAIRRTNGAMEFQVTAPTTGATAWLKAPGKRTVVESVSDSGGGNRYSTEWRFRLID